MPDYIVLYSTNSWLAFNIGERYYRGEHYVWCTPFFDYRTASSLGYTVPPTSCPREIFMNLYKEVTSGDRHSTKIVDNKIGILKGATIKKAAGVINDQQEKDIISIVNSSETRDFRPLLYVIPYSSVTSIAKEVPVGERAHPLSVEYRIDNLPRHLFDVIEIGGS